MRSCCSLEDWAKPQGGNPSPGAHCAHHRCGASLRLFLCPLQGTAKVKIWEAAASTPQPPRTQFPTKQPPHRPLASLPSQPRMSSGGAAPHPAQAPKVQPGWGWGSHPGTPLSCCEAARVGGQTEQGRRLGARGARLGADCPEPPSPGCCPLHGAGAGATAGAGDTHPKPANTQPGSACHGL